jgi:hypothetical protein
MDDKAPDQVFSFRGPEGLADRLDAHADRLAAGQPGVRVPRASAILNLVYRGLELAEGEDPS